MAEIKHKRSSKRDAPRSRKRSRSWTDPTASPHPQSSREPSNSNGALVCVGRPGFQLRQSEASLGSQMQLHATSATCMSPRQAGPPPPVAQTRGGQIATRTMAVEGDPSSPFVISVCARYLSFWWQKLAAEELKYDKKPYTWAVLLRRSTCLVWQTTDVKASEAPQDTMTVVRSSLGWWEPGVFFFFFFFPAHAEEGHFMVQGSGVADYQIGWMGAPCG
ncbi:hypothetical protein LY78DRAFT_295968 [Colletotrichum sublineola]|nr:hypothetical protein LY78DRAFT_295968 [Colletotrichum sublineola]